MNIKEALKRARLYQLGGLCCAVIVSLILLYATASQNWAIATIGIIPLGIGLYFDRAKAKIVKQISAHLKPLFSQHSQQLHASDRD